MKSETRDIYHGAADVETSSEDYAMRFSGPVGTWMLEKQKDIVLAAISETETDSILDVGGGHGQLAVPLSESGYRVTVVGSHPDCSQRLQKQIDKGLIRFDVGNLIDLPYPDNSFDTSVCFRFISHCPQWKRLIGELCRVARKSVIIDYPTWQSINIASPLLFRLKRRIEKNTRTYTLFSHNAIRKEFLKNDYEDLKRTNQFVFPMALHRMLQKPGLSDSMEDMCGRLGLTRLLGSPSILLARKI